MKNNKLTQKNYNNNTNIYELVIDFSTVGEVASLQESEQLKVWNLVKNIMMN